MEHPAIIFWTLLATAVFGVAARFLRQPYPIVMVLGGVLLALLPQLPTITMRPMTVFFVLLPALLFGAAWRTDFGEFKEFLGPIVMLALGLVVLTTVAVALGAHWLIGIPLASAFVLGAVLSPPDAIAVEAISETVPFPRAVGVILSGESLVNDATALVIYGFAVTAVITGAFSLAGASLEFVYVALVGTAIGIAIADVLGRLLQLLRKAKLADPAVTCVITIATPYLIYVPAEWAHASGVLAVVAGGIYLSRKSSALFDSESRIMANGVWDLLFFAFNGIAFILIGLQLRSVVAALGTTYSPLSLAWYALAVCAIVIGVRILTVLPFAYLRTALRRRLGLFSGPVPWRRIFVVGWAGMRGVVTLAAALAVPVATNSGAPFPARALILFLAFVVIAVTLIGQGLTLPSLIRRLRIAESAEEGPSVALAQLRTAAAARRRLRELERGFATTLEREVGQRLAGALDERIGYYGAVLDGRELDAREPAHERDRQMRIELCAAERRELEMLRDRGEISDRVFRRLEWQIDLVQAQLD